MFLNVRLPKTVDALRVVADDADVLLLLGQKIDQRKLQRVRVLVFVDEDVFEPVVVFLAHLCLRLAKQSNGLDQQIVEIECVRDDEAARHTSETLSQSRPRFSSVCSTCDANISTSSPRFFAAADRVSHDTRDDLFFVEAEVLDARLDHLLRIVGVVDRE